MNRQNDKLTVSKHDMKTYKSDILIVDDEIPNLQLLSQILSKEGYQVRPAERPQLAIDSAMTLPPSLILLDVKMEDIDGFEVCERLKQDERTRDIPIIFVIALQDVQDRIRGFEAGGVDYISKPFQEAEVLARVRTHMDLRNMQLHLEDIVADRTAELDSEVTELKQVEQAARLGEQLLSLVYDSIADVLFHIRVEPEDCFRFSSINQAFLDTTGLTKEQIIGKRIEEVIPEPSVWKVRDNYKKAIEENEIVRWEETSAYPTGKRTGVVSIAPILDEDGVCRQLVGSVHDITERKQVENLLKDSEARFKMISEHAPVLIDAFDSNGRAVMWNKECEKTFGWTREEILAHDNPLALFYPDPEVQRQVMETVISGPESTFREWKPKRKDGSEVTCLWANFRLPDGLVINLGYDITEQKKAEEKLLASEEKFRTLIAHIPDVTWTSDTEGNTTFISFNIKDIYGYSPEDIYRRGTELWLERIHPDDVETVRRAYKSLFETTGSRYDIEYRIKRKDGEWIWLHDRSIATYTKGGTAYADGILTDITDAKQAEEAVHQLREELLHASRVGTMSEFSASLAHEINHPLGSILNNANAARRLLGNEKPDMDEIHEIIDDIISENRRASDVIHKIKNLMKKAEPKYSALEINRVVEDVVSLTHGKLITGGVSLSKRLGKNIPKVKADRIQLQQVLLNLIINASDAMKESKVKNLSISTSKKDSEKVVVCMKDSGEGIAENEKDNLFKPFFTTKEEGMGLGLSISKTIIDAFGGDIWAENSKDGGASFFVSLPIYKKEKSS